MRSSDRERLPQLDGGLFLTGGTDHRHVEQIAAACSRYYWSGAGSWDAIPPARGAALNEPAHLAVFEALAVPTLILQGARSPRPTRASASCSRASCPMPG